ncbi:MAG: serine/threonine-protein kinase [Planctomycetales bacterium]|nr:serine/threonine-protein kinase [Planctomycetales bacterium]
MLHRDLKPQNILLDKYEEPKITDFGLAASAEENSQLTATGTVLGTPSYMPPEQARGKHDEMGKWSDIYSLGATLYESLVGRPPFTAATLGETLQQVMSVDPVSPRTLNPAIPRDIETICLKCLEKSPARRYQTGKELADELQRFLDDRPILARPTSRTEKFVRWCRRNPVIAGAIVAVTTAAVVAIVGLWVGRNQALEGERKATDALREADETAQDAMDMVDQLMTKISEETLLNQPGLQKVRGDILTRAEGSYNKLLGKLEKNKRLPEQIAMVQFKIGTIKHYLNSPVEALALYETATTSLQKLHDQDPNNLRLIRDLSDVKTQAAKLHYEQRRFAASAIPMQEALALRHELVDAEPANILAGQLLANSEMNMGLLEEDMGHPQQALAHYEAAQLRRKELLAKEPKNASLQRDQAKGLSNLGMFFARQQRLPEAEEFCKRAEMAFALLTNRKDRELDDLLNHGIVLRRLGDISAVRNNEQDLQRAIERYVKSVKLLEELVAANSTVRIYRGTLAAARLNLAVLYEREKNPREAFFLLTSAFDDFNKLKVEDAAYKRHEMKTFHEMLRLKKWNKLGQEQQEDLVYWLDFATTANGEPWVMAIEKQAATSAEYPQALRLEETDLLTPEAAAKP